MAWQCEVTSVKANPGADEWIVDVRYYDDATPTVTLFAVAFQFARGLTVPQMRAQIVAKGQALRTTYQDAVTRAQTFVGSVIDIP